MRKLHAIAEEIYDDWPKPYFGAVPYLERYVFTFQDE